MMMAFVCLVGRSGNGEEKTLNKLSSTLL
jgi:hypothetical protein